MLIVNPEERATIIDVVNYCTKQLEIIESKLSHQNSGKNSNIENRKEIGEDEVENQIL